MALFVHALQTEPRCVMFGTWAAFDVKNTDAILHDKAGHAWRHIKYRAAEVRSCYIGTAV